MVEFTQHEFKAMGDTYLDQSNQNKMITKMNKGLFQPRSQGISSSRPLEQERETLVGAGHVPLSRSRGWEE